jgi:hypothetical protein
MTTSVRSLAEQQKFGRIFFHHHSPFSSFRTTKIRQNFFVPSAHSSFTIPVFHLFMVQPTSPILIFDLGFRLFSPIDYLGSTRPRLSTFVPTLTRPLRPSIHPSISSCCFDILLSTAVSIFVLGPLGCAVYPMLTVGLTCTQLSRPFSSWVCHVSDARGGCNVYPRLAFLFYLVRPVTSRPSSMF